VPLDPAYPERLAFMIEDSQVPVLLTQQKLLEGLPEHRAHVVASTDDDTKHCQENPKTGVTAET